MMCDQSVGSEGTVNALGNYFNPGAIIVAKEALESVDHDFMLLQPCLERHLKCDFGELGQVDLKPNLESLKHGGVLWSRYTIENTAKTRRIIIHIRTNTDRTKTIIYIPGKDDPDQY